MSKDKNQSVLQQVNYYSPRQIVAVINSADRVFMHIIKPGETFIYMNTKQCAIVSCEKKDKRLMLNAVPVEQSWFVGSGGKKTGSLSPQEIRGQEFVQRVNDLVAYAYNRKHPPVKHILHHDLRSNLKIAVALQVNDNKIASDMVISLKRSGELNIEKPVNTITAIHPDERTQFFTKFSNIAPTENPIMAVSTMSQKKIDKQKKI